MLTQYGILFGGTEEVSLTLIASGWKQPLFGDC